jgi:hypothetical protein
VSGIKFEPGQIVATPGVLEEFRASGEDPLTYLVRHLNGDWGYYRYKERRGTQENDEFLAPPQLNWPMWSLFYLKSAMMLVAYACYIIPFLASKLRP